MLAQAVLRKMSMPLASKVIITTASYFFPCRWRGTDFDEPAMKRPPSFEPFDARAERICLLQGIIIFFRRAARVEGVAAEG